MDNFLFRCTENYLESKQNFVVSTIKQLADGVGDEHPSTITLPDGFYNNTSGEMMFSAIEKLNDIITNNHDIVSFFENLCKSETMDDDVTNAVRTIEWSDTNAVKKIKPEYLEEYVTQIATLIDEMLKGDITEDKLNQITSDEYCNTMKSNLVRRSLSCPLKGFGDLNFEIPKSDCVINDTFIRNTILPFVQSINTIREEINQERDGVLNLINTAKDKIKLYQNTIQNMNIKGNIAADKITALNKFLFNASHLVQECLYYITFMLILKTRIHSQNMKSVVSLKDRTTSRTSKELASNMIQHITDDDMMRDMISGSVSAILDSVNMILNKQYSEYSVHNNTNSNFIDVNVASASYDEDTYDLVYEIFKSIDVGIKNLSKNIKDKYIAFDRVIEKCGFGDPLTTRFLATVSSIPNISVYQESYEKMYAGKVFFCLMKELSVAEESYWRHTGSKIRETYDSIVRFREDVRDNINNEYPNRVLNSEIVDFLYSLETDFKNMVAMIGKNFITRYNCIDSFASSLHDEQETILDVNAMEHVWLDTTDYTESVDKLYLEFVCSMNDMNIRHANQYYNEAVNRNRFGFLMEDNATTNNTQTPGQNTTQSSGSVTVTQNENQMSDADKQQNNEASAKSGTSSSDKNDPDKKASFKEKMQELRKKIEKFFSDISTKWANMINKLRGKTGEWVSANKEAILGRSFNGVVLKMPPYDGYDASNILTDMTTLGNTISSLTDNDIKSFTDENSIYKKLLPNTNPNGMDYKEYIEMYYQFGKDVPKADNGKYTPVEYKNGALKSLVEKMIAFCEEYYSGSGADTLGKESENVRSKLDSKVGNLETSLSLESVATIGKLSFCVQTITGTMMNAYRNRCNDYIKALHGLVPKKSKSAPVDNSTNNNGSDENFTPNDNSSNGQSEGGDNNTNQ